MWPLRFKVSRTSHFVSGALLMKKNVNQARRSGGARKQRDVTLQLKQMVLAALKGKGPAHAGPRKPRRANRPSNGAAPMTKAPLTVRDKPKSEPVSYVPLGFTTAATAHPASFASDDGRVIQTAGTTFVVKQFVIGPPAWNYMTLREQEWSRLRKKRGMHVRWVSQLPSNAAGKLGITADTSRGDSAKVTYTSVTSLDLQALIASMTPRFVGMAKFNASLPIPDSDPMDCEFVACDDWNGAVHVPASTFRADGRGVVVTVCITGLDSTLADREVGQIFFDGEFEFEGHHAPVAGEA